MDSLNLIPVDDEMIRKIDAKYREYMLEGMTELKAGYFAITAFGFNGVLKTTKNNIQMVRVEDLNFVIFSYEIKRVPVVHGSFNPVSTVTFHTNLSVFKDGEGI